MSVRLKTAEKKSATVKIKQCARSCRAFRHDCLARGSWRANRLYDTAVGDRDGLEMLLKRSALLLDRQRRSPAIRRGEPPLRFERCDRSSILRAHRFSASGPDHYRTVL